MISAQMQTQTLAFSTTISLRILYSVNIQSVLGKVRTLLCILLS